TGAGDAGLAGRAEPGGLPLGHPAAGADLSPPCQLQVRPMTARLIGIDWGTSSFRAWRMDAAGRVLDSLDTGPGILAAGQEPGGFPGALERAVGPWLGRGVPVI